jgi:putative endonuclease
VRFPYVYLGTLFDKWYEELPWRKGIDAGRRGEQIAARHLRRCGYIILARNYRAAGAEIDLVALDRETLVFVEVKARGGAGFGMPQEAVDHEKRERIRRAALAFAQRRGAGDLPARFDVVAINGVGRRRRLLLLKDAF